MSLHSRAVLLFEGLPEHMAYVSTAPALEVGGGDRPSEVIESRRAAEKKSLWEGEQVAGSFVRFGTFKTSPERDGKDARCSVFIKAKAPEQRESLIGRTGQLRHGLSTGRGKTSKVTIMTSI